MGVQSSTLFSGSPLEHKTCNISETAQDRIDQGYSNGLIGSCIRAFDSYQNKWPWMTLNGRNASLA